MITEPRIEAAQKMLAIWHVQHWAGETVDLLAGTAWGEKEVVNFQNDISRIQPKFSALLTPSHAYDFKDPPLKWSSHFWLDRACVGDLIGG